MAYQVLARKWRPQTFETLIGQEHVAQTLLNALKSGRMPHALLFTGARGVGKTSAARILAKSLRCPNAKDFIPCNECPDCVEITEGRAMDVSEIDGASNNSVDDVRVLRENIGYMPSRGRMKVYIIDEVHMLSTSAFNALLKTLEEPPEHVVFIFATTEVQKIPVTILSRCQRFDFRRIPIRRVAEHLKTIADKEGVKADPQALWLLARESEGSMRDSQSLLDQVITFSGDEITYAKVIDVLGLTDRTLLSETLRALLDRDVGKCLDILERIFHHGYDPKQFAQDLLEHLRNFMLVKVSTAQGKSTDFIDLPDQEISELAKWSQSLSEEDIHLLFDMTLKGVSDVVRTQDPRIVLEMLLLRMSQAPRIIEISNLIAGGGSLPHSAAAPAQGSTVAPQTISAPPSSGNPQRAESSSRMHTEVRANAPAPAPATPAAAPQATPAPSQAPGGASLQDVSWPGFINQVKREKPMLGAKLEYAFCEDFYAPVVRIGYRKDKEFFHAQVNVPEIVKQLTEIARRLRAAPEVKVEVILVATEAAMPSMKEARDAETASQNEAVRKATENHPLIQQVQDTFKAKITSIKELN